MITIIPPAREIHINCGCVIGYTKDDEITSCEYCEIHQEVYGAMKILWRRIWEDEIKEHPPDLGIHVEDGVKAEIKRGE